MEAVNSQTRCVQAETVVIERVANVDTLNIVQDVKTVWEHFIHGASWSSGAALSGYVVYKVCDVVWSSLAGAEAGAQAGAAFGPNGVVLGAMLGGVAGAAKGIIV